MLFKSWHRQKYNILPNSDALLIGDNRSIETYLLEEFFQIEGQILGISQQALKYLHVERLKNLLDSSSGQKKLTQVVAACNMKLSFLLFFLYISMLQAP